MAADETYVAQGLRIAVVVLAVFRFDGIGNAVRDTIRVVSSVPQWNVTVLIYSNEFDDLSAVIVTRAHDLAAHPKFAAVAIISRREDQRCQGSPVVGDVWQSSTPVAQPAG